MTTSQFTLVSSSCSWCAVTGINRRAHKSRIQRHDSPGAGGFARDVRFDLVAADRGKRDVRTGQPRLDSEDSIRLITSESTKARHSQQ